MCDSLAHQIHPETNHVAQQVSGFLSTVTTMCNPDSTLSYGESGGPVSVYVCVSQDQLHSSAESLSCVEKPDPAMFFS